MGLSLGRRDLRRFATKSRVHIGCCRNAEQAGGNLGNCCNERIA
jgi:hypothetical protein